MTQFDFMRDMFLPDGPRTKRVPKRKQTTFTPPEYARVGATWKEAWQTSPTAIITMGTFLGAAGALALMVAYGCPLVS